MRHDELTTRAAAALTAAERLPDKLHIKPSRFLMWGWFNQWSDGLVGPLLAKLGVGAPAVADSS